MLRTLSGAQCSTSSTLVKHSAVKRQPQLWQSRTRHLKVSCNVYDTSVRVKGDVRRVFLYVSDFANLPAWYPGVTAVSKTKGDTVTMKSQFSVQRMIYKWEHISMYEVVEFEAGRKVTYNATSQLHTATHALHFMEDPNDPGFTNIRYLKQIKLRGTAGPLQPLVAGHLKQLPEQGLGNLARMLNRADTPLRFIKLDAADEAAVKQRARAKQAGGGWSWQSLLDGISAGASASMTGSMDGTQSGHMLADALGYYTLMSLHPGKPYTQDEIKSAYRKAAMDLHPDRFANAPEDERSAAQLRFQKLQKAYTIMKEPTQKAMYDSGKILSDFVV